MRKALIVGAAPLIAAVVIAGAYRSIIYHQIYKRFPDYDRKIIRKAYSRMMTDAVKGNLPVNKDASDAELDALFIKMYNVEKFLSS